VQGAIYVKRGEDKSISCPYFTKTSSSKYIEIGTTNKVLFQAFIYPRKFYPNSIYLNTWIRNPVIVDEIALKFSLYLLCIIIGYHNWIQISIVP